MEEKNCKTCDKGCGTNLKLKPDTDIVLNDIFDKVPVENIQIFSISLDKLLENEQLHRQVALRWNYGKKRSSGNSNFNKNFNKLSGNEIKDFVKKLKLSQVLDITANIGYFRCYSKENSIFLLDSELQELGVYTFHRSKQPPYISVADFFLSRPEADGDVDNSGIFDISPLLQISLGQKIYDYIDNLLYNKKMYKEVFQIHGLLDVIHEIALFETKKYILSHLFHNNLSTGIFYSLNNYSLLGEYNINSVIKLFKEPSPNHNSDYEMSFYDDTYIFSYHKAATNVIL